MSAGQAGKLKRMSDNAWEDYLEAGMAAFRAESIMLRRAIGLVTSGFWDLTLEADREQMIAFLDKLLEDVIELDDHLSPERNG